MALRTLEEIDFSDWARQLKTESIDELKTALRAAHAVTALGELAFEQSRGNLLQPIQFVDNLPRKKLKNVKFGGRIEFRDQAQFSDEGTEKTNMIREVMGHLRAHSPTRDVNYIRSHIVFYNGVQVAPTSVLPLGPGDSMIFVNYMPYAKRLEGQAQPAKSRAAKKVRKDIRGTNNAIKARRQFGPTDEDYRTPTPWEENIIRSGGKYTPSSKKYMSTQAPNGVYAAVWKKLAKTYRGLINVQFKYMAFQQFVGDGYHQNRKGGAWKTIIPKYVETGGSVVYPVIVIQLADSGNINTGRLN
jgi:hypothetical protein